MKRKFKLLLLLTLACAALTALPTLAADPAQPTVYVAGWGNDSAAGTSADAPFKTLYAAARALPSGGRIVLCGALTQTATELPATDGLLTITSVADKDYRMAENGSAVLSLGGNLSLRGPVKFENINLTATVKNLVILCHGNYTRMGEGITTAAVGEGVLLPGITAGSTGAASSDGAYLEICSGDWYRIRGGARGTSSVAQAGDVFITIRGGSFGSTFDLGGDSPCIGNAYLRVYGGQFKASVNGASAVNTDGNITVSLYGGSFSSGIRISRGGALNGNFTVNAFTDLSASVSAGTGTMTGEKTLNVLEGKTANISGFTRQTIDEAAYQAMVAQEEQLFDAARAAKLPESENAFESRDMTPSGSAEKVVFGAENINYGDLNEDGYLSINDVLTAFRMMVSGKYEAIADSNFDGRITSEDAMMILWGILNDQRRLFPQAPENLISSSLDLYGGAIANGGAIEKGFAFGSTAESAYTLSAAGIPKEHAKIGLYFGCDLSGGPSALDGYYFEIDADASSATLYTVKNGSYRVTARRTVEIFDTPARLRVVYRNNWADLYFENNIFDNAPYPIFNLALQSDGNGVGLYTENARVSLPAVTAAESLPESGYTNTLLENFTDPEIFFADGRYYLYGTQGNTANSGVKCYSTTNFRTFRDEGFALRAGDAFGDGIFKAANIVYYNGMYYMFYMAESNALGTSVTACAASPSLTGPFKNDDKTPLTNDKDFIGGQPFVDSDGSVYLVYTRTTGGNRLYGAKISLSGGKAEIDLSTETLLLEPTEPWENAKASVVECGYIIRHGNLYYLMYSGGNYNSTYGTGYATAESPLGPYTKYDKNPVLTSNDQAFGVGASTVFTSPDGSEHFILYLRNFSPTVTRPLCTGMDRIKFVRNPNGGPDLISISGPTVTKQPLPSGLSNIEAFVSDPETYQKSRFIW